MKPNQDMKMSKANMLIIVNGKTGKKQVEFYPNKSNSAAYTCEKFNSG